MMIQPGWDIRDFLILFKSHISPGQIRIPKAVQVHDIPNLYLAALKISPLPSPDSNLGLLDGMQIVYHVALKAGLYRKAVHVYDIPNLYHVDIHRDIIAQGYISVTLRW